MARVSESPDLFPITGSPWTGIRYGCTTRYGGVSGGQAQSLNLGLHTGDDPQAVHENRRRLRAALPSEPFWLEQVHGVQVADADEPRKAGMAVSCVGGAFGFPRADASVTTRPGRVLAIMTADCLPIVIGAIDGTALGVAHAGWRGLAAGVLESTLAALKSRRPQVPAWRAWIGPGIGQTHFEVGEDVRTAFVTPDPETSIHFAPGRKPGKWQADLASLACHRLERMGVHLIEPSNLCTYERAELFYSYRRLSTTGRMATVAWLENPGNPENREPW